MVEAETLRVAHPSHTKWGVLGWSIPLMDGIPVYLTSKTTSKRARTQWEWLIKWDISWIFKQQLRGHLRHISTPSLKLWLDTLSQSQSRGCILLSQCYGLMDIRLDWSTLVTEWRCFQWYPKSQSMALEDIGIWEWIQFDIQSDFWSILESKSAHTDLVARLNSSQHPRS